MSPSRFPVPLPMPTRPGRAAAVAVAVLVALAAFPALAASPFGVGLPEASPASSGPFAPLFLWISAWQTSFYNGLRAAIRGLGEDGNAGLLLAALSFGYGVFHAAGPGHGKAVVSSYVLANRETARNGAVLSLVSAFAQAATAIVLVTVAAVLLGATGIAMTRVAGTLEIGSYALITGLGLWLVWQKALAPAGRALATRSAGLLPRRALAAEPAPRGDVFAFAAATGEGSRPSARPARAAAASAAFSCDGGDHADDCRCGGHVAPAASASGRLDLAKAWSAIFAVGLRPCTGALIVLVFALSQGHYLAGIGATLAMALGTGLTVATLVLVAVGARDLAARLAAGGGRGERLYRGLHRGVEVAGALAVLAFGGLMLGGALAAG